MKEQIASLLQEIETLTAVDANEAENHRIRLLGRKGIITQLFEDFKKF